MRVFIIWSKEPKDVVFHDIKTDMGQAYGVQRQVISDYKRQRLEYGVFVTKMEVDE